MIQWWLFLLIFEHLWWSVIICVHYFINIENWAVRWSSSMLGRLNSFIMKFIVNLLALFEKIKEDEERLFLGIFWNVNLNTFILFFFTSDQQSSYFLRFSWFSFHSCDLSALIHRYFKHFFMLFLVFAVYFALIHFMSWNFWNLLIPVLFNIEISTSANRQSWHSSDFSFLTMNPDDNGQICEGLLVTRLVLMF